MAYKTKDNAEMARSSRTRFVESSDKGAIYSHTLKHVHGTHVVLWASSSVAWNAYDSLEKAQGVLRAGYNGR